MAIPAILCVNRVDHVVSGVMTLQVILSVFEFDTIVNGGGNHLTTDTLRVLAMGP